MNWGSVVAGDANTSRLWRILYNTKAYTFALYSAASRAASRQPAASREAFLDLLQQQQQHCGTCGCSLLHVVAIIAVSQCARSARCATFTASALHPLITPA